MSTHLGILACFTFSMLCLVMSDNFLVLFFGWEGVGLFSYLLIGFYYQKKLANEAELTHLQEQLTLVDSNISSITFDGGAADHGNGEMGDEEMEDTLNLLGSESSVTVEVKELQRNLNMA